MTPVKQTIKHDPTKGQYGDCHRAAIATVLDLPIEDVPHFVHDDCSPEEFCRRERAFLAQHGLTSLHFAYQAPDLQTILDTVAAFNGQDTVYLVGGLSPRGVNHSVVARGNALVHDPSPNDGFLVGPCDDGWWWLTFFGSTRVNAKEAA